MLRRNWQENRKFRKTVFGVLEGGYVGENIANDLHEFIQGIESKKIC